MQTAFLLCCVTHIFVIIHLKSKIGLFSAHAFDYCCTLLTDITGDYNLRLQRSLNILDLFFKLVGALSRALFP